MGEFKIGQSVADSFIKRKVVTANVSTSGTTTDFASFFPAGCVPLSITVEVTTAIGNDGYISKVGTDGDDDAFADSIGDGVLEEQNDTITIMGQAASPDTASWFAAADNLRLTHANQPDAGAVKLTMIYIDGASL